VEAVEEAEDQEEAEALEHGQLGRTTATVKAHVPVPFRSRGEDVSEELDVEEAAQEVLNAKNQAVRDAMVKIVTAVLMKIPAERTKGTVTIISNVKEISSVEIKTVHGEVATTVVGLVRGVGCAANMEYGVRPKEDDIYKNEETMDWIF